MIQSQNRSLFHMLLTALAGLIGLGASLMLALQAGPQATRLAVVVPPWGQEASWRAIEASGLPVVRLLWGGALVLLDGRAMPEGLQRLRAAPLLLLDGALLPGCGPPDPSGRATTSEQFSDGRTLG